MSEPNGHCDFPDVDNTESSLEYQRGEIAVLNLNLLWLTKRSYYVREQIKYIEGNIKIRESNGEQ